MQVYIMRHGDAALEAPSDAQRPLTQTGRSESQDMAVWLAQQTVGVERVLVSPYLRAQQTLEIVNHILPPKGPVDILPELTPGGDVRQAGDYLRMLAIEGVGSVLVISHLPLVGYLVAELCPGEQPPMFCTSAIASVTLPADGQAVYSGQTSPCTLNGCR